MLFLKIIVIKKYVLLLRLNLKLFYFILVIFLYSVVMIVNILNVICDVLLMCSI